MNLNWHASLCILLLMGTGCAKQASSSSNNKTTIQAAKLSSGIALSGSGTTKGSVTVTQSALYYSNVGMVRFNDPWGSKELIVDLGTYDSTNDFGGNNGSMTLVAETEEYPLTGGAYPVLTSFYVVPATGGSTVEYVNLTSACQSQGMWNCTNGVCSANAYCTVQTPSSFGGRTDWDQHQVPPYGYSTTNTFPRCDSSVNGWSSCAAGGSLVSGHYYAKYLLLSDSGDPVSSSLAKLKVTLSVKKDTADRNTGSTNGGLNLNIILVGDQNINDSHTDKGARNMKLLISEVDRLFSTVAGSKLSISQVKVYEWSDANGGSQYSQVEYANLGNLFEAGSKGVDAADSGKNINVFLVSDISYSGASFTILGLSGAILGPPVNGTQTSGLAFSSFDKLASFNPSCTSDTCARETLQNDFLEMAATIVHEMGHFLGLNHPSEKPDSTGSQDVDQLSDTPSCAGRSSGGSYYLDQRSCYVTDKNTTQNTPLSGPCFSACNAVTGGTGTSLADSYLLATRTPAGIDPWTSYTNSDMPGKFCPAVQECQFNHVMWYTTKNRKLLKTVGGGTCTSIDATAGNCTWYEDGNLFSPQSNAILQWDPFVL